MELFDDLTTDRVLFFKGDVDAFANEDGNVYLPHDVVKTKQFLQNAGLITGEEAAVPRYIYVDDLHYQTLLLRLFDSTDVSERKRRSKSKGAFVVECNLRATKVKGDYSNLVPYRLGSGSKTDTFFMISMYHALVGIPTKDDFNGAGSTQISAALSDIKLSVTGNRDSVKYCAFESFSESAPVGFEPYLRLNHSSLEIRAWCVNNLETTLQQVLDNGAFKELVEAYKHVQMVAEGCNISSYEPRTDFHKPVVKETTPEQSDVLVALTQRIYKPALEIAAEVVKDDGNMRLLMNII